LSIVLWHILGTKVENANGIINNSIKEVPEKGRRDEKRAVG
jgi:hypothetical protein